MTNEAIYVTLASAAVLVLFAMSDVLFLTVLATSAAWCLIIWAVYVR